jgi:hypothetical protein
MGNIIPFPGNHNERQPRLSGLRRESATKRWPIRHNAEQQGISVYNRTIAPVTAELGANVVNIATHPDYNYHVEQPAAEVTPSPTPTPAEAPIDITQNPELDIDEIRRYIDEIAS